MENSFKNVTPSYIFWQAALLSAIIVTAIISIQAFWVLEIILSICTFLYLIDADVNTPSGKEIWIWFTATAWLLLILAICFFIVHILYQNTILRFNDWLNKKGKKRK